jgi:hypothetical protein
MRLVSFGGKHTLVRASGDTGKLTVPRGLYAESGTGYEPNLLVVG